MAFLDWICILPQIIIAATALAIMLASAFYKGRGISLLLTAIGLAAAFIALWMSAPHAPRLVTALFAFDRVTVFFTGLLILGGLFSALLSADMPEAEPDSYERYMILLLLAVLGATVLAGADHLASLFLGLEILSISLYGLIAYRRMPSGIEAGIKYLILASVSSACRSRSSGSV